MNICLISEKSMLGLHVHLTDKSKWQQTRELDKYRVRSVICFLHAKGNTVQDYQELIAIYGEHAMSRIQISV
jgi:hypothetical protein